MRLIWIFIGLGLLVLIPFLIWGSELEARWTQQGAVEWLRSYGNWAWLAALTLLVSDLFLPIPGTAIMSACGLVYGALWGGLLSALGSILSGLLAYGLSRLLGRSAVVFLVGEEDLNKGEKLFGQYGGWMVAISRWAPMAPEIVSCLAGMTRMRFREFLLALVCGSLPLGMTFAWIGSRGAAHPILVILISAGLPPVLWWGIHRQIHRWNRAVENQQNTQD